MKAACFIPIKSNSERVPGKNLRMFLGKKLYEHICENVIKANVFDDIFIDTNCEEIVQYAKKRKIAVINRKPELASNSANGNDLLIYHLSQYPNYDYYFQAFATAPFLQPNTIQYCFDKLVSSAHYDSCFTATEHYGFFWFADTPMNYRPSILPRSQDMRPVIEETTGLYGIAKESLEKYHSRIGRNPYIHIVSKFEAVDINTEDDLKIAEYIGKEIFHLGIVKTK